MDSKLTTWGSRQIPLLPITEHLGDVASALAHHAVTILSAPPGSGKTTLTPPALLNAGWLNGGVMLILEPRRLAARAAATRVASLLGETVGETVGYHVRLERRLSGRSRILFLTEGLLTQRLLSDPLLDGVGLVVFDEFHERSLHADTALAFCREVQESLRPDLRILIMSATLDADLLKRRFPEARHLTVDAPSWPVETLWLERPPAEACWRTAHAAVMRALIRYAGDLLVFLPGEPEIRRAHASLKDALPEGVRLHALFGAMPSDAQEAALTPAPAGSRKVVLASAIAESSLTIEGVRVVIDAGWMRSSVFSPHWGLDRLQTRRVTRDRADQRRGRAGREAPGVCLRLWDAGTERALQPHAPPEILEADLAGVVLQAADWGVTDPGGLPWITPPPPSAWGPARDLLSTLRALDERGCITAHGRRMVRIGVHPRLAHMMVTAQGSGNEADACRLAALISELARGGGHHRETDLTILFETVVRKGRDAGVSAARVRRLAAGWMRKSHPAKAAPDFSLGDLLSLAYPDRLCRRIGGQRGRYQFRAGYCADLDSGDPLGSVEWLIVPEIQKTAAGGRIRRAAPIDNEAVRTIFGEHVRERVRAFWDESRGAARAVRLTMLNAITLAERELPEVPDEAAADLLLDAVRRRGLAALSWSETTEQMRRRVMLLARLFPEDNWPAMEESALLDQLEGWLLPFLAGCRRLDRITPATLATALSAMLSPNQRAALESLAPTHVSAPSGSRHRIRFGIEEPPVLAVRIQEAFGWMETPRIAGGRLPLIMHLLSPARRPVQITSDLAGFWRTGYAEARKQLRARYPRHAWPEIPGASGAASTGSSRVGRRAPSGS